jgi:hypothetical protein
MSYGETAAVFRRRGVKSKEREYGVE